MTYANQAAGMAASQNTTSPTYTSAHPQNVTMTVERVDNGFILRSARYQGDIAKVKICTNMDELKDLFVATLVEHQLES